MRTRIKICGITRLDDARTAVEAGADALGFVFYPSSPRYIDPDRVREIIRRLPPMVTRVGLFVDEKIQTVKEIEQYCFLDLLQFHGRETPEYCEWFPGRAIKAIGVKDISPLEEMKRYSVSGFLLDACSEDLNGGTGCPFDWSLAIEAAKSEPVMLAGGLTPENVGEAILKIHPYAVDVSSGVGSSPGEKDPDRTRRFISAVRRADQDRFRVENEE